MRFLVLGLALWVVPHMFKRLAPGARAALGTVPGKMLVTVLTLAALILMVIGFRRADFVPVYEPYRWAVPLNNMLMLIAVFLMGAGKVPGVVRHHLRHPMLTGVLVWAIAHLLVNGDRASLVLFGTLGVWAVVQMLLINLRTPWVRPAKGRLRADAVLLGISVVLLGLIAAVHTWLGYNPFRMPGS